VKQASETQDPTEVSEPQGRGWFQPKPKKPAAQASAPPAKVNDTQTQTNASKDPADGQTASPAGPAADTDEPAVQLKALRLEPDERATTQFKALRSDPDEPATTVFKAVRPDTGKPAPKTSTGAADAADSPAISSSPQADASGSDAAIATPAAAKESDPKAKSDKPAAEPGPQSTIDSPKLVAASRPGPGDTPASANGSPAAASGTSAPAKGSSAAANGTRAPAAGKPAAKKRSVFGTEPAARPDMLTDAETVVMPSLNGSPSSATELGDLGSASATAGATKEPQDTPMTPVATSAIFAEADTQIMLLVKPGQQAAGAGTKRARRLFRKRPWPPFTPPERYTPARRTTWISRLLLLSILILQAVLSLRLHNTAFEDESLYLYSGHMELEHLLHGTALQGAYSSYFSGSPVLYPVAAAFLDQIGGLALARGLSLFEMLATTVILYSMTRRLFNERAGLLAAALFSVCESAIFLGNFATYDATCLSLLAFAAWIMVRTSAFRWPVFLLAAPVAALAVGVKYAGLLFVPTIAVLPVLAGWPERGRRTLLIPPAFIAAVGALLYGALRWGGKPYMAAISSTTTNRAQGATPDLTILREAAEWGGVIFVLAVFGTIAYAWRVHTEPNEKIAPAGGRFRRAALGIVLTGSGLLAPAYQAHLHTDISFLKHIGFGLFFAAPMAGFGLARVMGDYFRRPQFGVAAWSLALVLGMVQSNYLYHQWPSSQPFVTAFAKHVTPGGKYLVEVPEPFIYYLQGNKDAQPDQFTSTYYINYFNSKGVLLTGTTGFTAAVQGGYFQIIAYNDDVTLAADQALATALKASKSYYLAKKVVTSDSLGPVDYYIWVKKAATTPVASKAKSAKK
jgi:Dolichyl-phosphate-mannose-protein mannosyltransferase